MAANGSPSADDLVHVQGQPEFDQLVDDDALVLVDFHADWCGPCQMLEPIVETMAAETSATVAKVDVDQNQQLAAAHGIRGVPTMELYRDGEQVEQMVGVQSEDQLRGLIQRYEA